MKKNLLPIIFIVTIIVINVISVFVLNEFNVAAFIASIAGVISVVMAAKGHIGCYYLGIVNILSYMFVTYESKFYGALTLLVLFSLPMQFYGIYHWKKHLKDDSKTVKTRKLSLKILTIIFLTSVVAAILYSYILTIFNSQSPILESMITMFNIIAILLYVKRYSEQWLFWMLINGISVVMWIMATINNDPNGILMIVTWTIYFVNSVYGYFNWRNLMEGK